jgi:hypothetical protein
MIGVGSNVLHREPRATAAGRGVREVHDEASYRKAVGREAKLSYMGHATMENRNGPAVARTITLANGTAERRASAAMLNAKSKAVGHRIGD